MNQDSLRYQQARQEILARIKQQALQPGDQLPSEEALGAMIGVSRNTIRDALMTLERDGVVIRRHGMGTFMAAAPAMLETRLNEILPIPDLIRASGHTPGVRNPTFERHPGPSSVHEILRVPAGVPLGVLSLLHVADERPAIYITYYLIPAIAQLEIDWAQFDGHLQNLIESSLPTRIHQTVAQIYAVPASAEIAARLQVAPHSPLLLFHHTAYTVEGQPLYFSTSYQDSNLLGVTVVRRRT